MTLPSLMLLVAFAVALSGLAAQRARLGRPVAPPLAPARASAAAGVRYAFTTAFLPWAKESARRHLPSYLAWTVFHLAVFAAVGRLALSVVPAAWPASANLVLAALLGVGLACGLGLLAKRRRDPTLRAVSTPEDVVANLLVDVVLLAGIAAALRPALIPAFQLAGAVLLLYAPLGKLRHMLFLVTSRRLWGSYFGRRGVRPAPDPVRSGRG
jgi:hypothetical protein